MNAIVIPHLRKPQRRCEAQFSASPDGRNGTFEAAVSTAATGFIIYPDALKNSCAGNKNII